MMRQLTPAQRLAAVVGKCFATQPAPTRTALRHAVYTQWLGREITSSDDLTDDEIRRMLEIWEDWQVPFSPNARALKECNQLAREYQKRRGQSEMVL